MGGGGGLGWRRGEGGGERRPRVEEEEGRVKEGRVEEGGG